MNRVQLWARLSAAGAVQGELPASAEVPLSVRIMLGLGAWLASLFALAFLGVTLYGFFGDPAPRLIVAVIAGTVAWRLAPQGDARPFAGQIGLALACLMQLLLFWLLIEGLRGNFAAGLGLMTVGAVSLLIASFIWRMWSTWVLITGLAVFLQPFQNLWLLALLISACAALCAWLLLYPAVWAARAPWLRPVALALGMAALGMSLWHPQLGWSTGLLLEFTDPNRLKSLAMACSIGLMLVNLYSAWVLARRLRTGPILIGGALLLIIALGLLTLITPAVSAALGLLLLGYGRGQPVLAVLGIIGLLLGLSTHYYALSWSLNLKAAGLLGLGILLLLARELMRRNRPASAAGRAS